MKYFLRIGILCIWVSASWLALCSFHSDACAREPQPGIESPIDGMVGGEPGEDPHLRHMPETKIEPIWTPGGSGTGGSVGSGAIGGSECLVREDSAASGGALYAKPLWQILMNAFSCVLSR